MPGIRVGTASPANSPTKAGTLRQVAHLARQPAARSIDVFLLPEAFIGGYPRGTAFGCVIGERTNQDVLYIYIIQTGAERLVWAQGSPSTLRAVSTTIRGTRVNLAAAICWENYMPVVRQALYAQNINLYLAPTADGRDAWLSLMRTVGIEGRCFVVSSNMAVRRDASPVQTSSRASPTRGHGDGDGRPRRSSTIAGDGFDIVLPSTSPSRHNRRKSVLDKDGNEIILCCDADASEKPRDGPKIAQVPSEPIRPGRDWISRGGSSIVDPFGHVIAGPQWEDDSGLIYADIDLRECIKGRLDIDVAGSYSRNDSFHFSVNGLNLDPLPY